VTDPAIDPVSEKCASKISGFGTLSSGVFSSQWFKLQDYFSPTQLNTVLELGPLTQKPVGDKPRKPLFFDGHIFSLRLVKKGQNFRKKSVFSINHPK